jgi:ribonuclease BN (tRNA processing enzyme)
VISDVVVTFTPTVHYIPAWAIRVHVPGAPDLGYTGDTGPATPLTEFFSGVGVLVAEATLLGLGAQSAAERGSLTAAEAGKLADAVGAGTLVMTHMWEELGFAAYCAQAAEVFPGQIEMASPGLIISW